MTNSLDKKVLVQRWYTLVYTTYEGVTCHDHSGFLDVVPLEDVNGVSGYIFASEQDAIDYSRVLYDKHGVSCAVKSVDISCTF